jgi:S-adenosylmethionine-diacylgycerolhomoserine-N-methlytransferase
MSAPRSGTAIERYYQFHARIYDATRWTFLFGRTAILRRAVAAGARPTRILEVGCGTGRNLVNLCRHFPDAAVTGLDLSESMLKISRRKVQRWGDRVQLVQRAYDAPISGGQPFDFILCSYALSMFNPGFEMAIEAAHADLASEGHIAVVDFHNTRWRWFERWMGVNHVRMQAQLQPKLRSLFTPVVDQVSRAYLGMWRYLLFVGRRG